MNLFNFIKKYNVKTYKSKKYNKRKLKSRRKHKLNKTKTLKLTRKYRKRKIGG